MKYIYNELEGCLIRELANKSKGAQIKVLSERDAEADSGIIKNIL